MRLVFGACLLGLVATACGEPGVASGPGGVGNSGNLDASVDAATASPEGSTQDSATAIDEGTDGAVDSNPEASPADGGAGCLIDATFYATGAPNPNTVCQSCQPTVSASGWSNDADGTSCGSAGICRAGTCVSGCEIGGVYYAANSTDPNNGCQSCQPGTSSSAWSSVTDGTACGNGQVCASGTCGTQCDIGGTVYASGAANPTNACQSCQPGTSTTSWTAVATGTSCGAASICNGPTCVADCYVGGTVYTTGQANPGNPCQSCQPTASTTNFTSVANGMSCGAGEVCKAGTCGSGCSIAGVVYGAAATNPSNACQSCQPNVSTAGWTNVSGTTCGTGEVCASGTCLAGCFIAGTFYSSGSINPGNACQVCQPTASTTAWSMGSIPNGTQCGLQCVNEQTDPQNCGACGAVCGGTCTAGRCIVTLANGISHPLGLALDTANVYWSSSGDNTISKLPLTSGGTGTPIVLVSSQALSSGYADFLVSNGTNLYFTDVYGYGVMSVPVGGNTPVIPTTLASSQGQPAGIAVDSANIYWIDQVQYDGGTSGGSLVKLPLTGGPPITLATGLSETFALAINSTNVFFYSSNGSSGSVMTVPLSGTGLSTATTAALGAFYPLGIAIDSTNVYWTDIEGGNIMYASLGAINAAPTILASGQGTAGSTSGEPLDIAVDATNVYWTTRQGGTVMTVAKSGGTPVTLAAGGSFTGPIGVDASYVYWIDAGTSPNFTDGRIMRITK